MTFETMIKDQVHVRMVDAAKTTETGKLFIPESAKQTRQLATVLRVGPEAYFLEEGMTVHLESFAGVELSDATMVVRAVWRSAR